MFIDTRPGTIGVYLMYIPFNDFLYAYELPIPEIFCQFVLHCFVCNTSLKSVQRFHSELPRTGSDILWERSTFVFVILKSVSVKYCMFLMLLSIIHPAIHFPFIFTRAAGRAVAIYRSVLSGY